MSDSNVVRNGTQGLSMELTRLVLDAVLSATADAVVATDRDGMIQVRNPGAARIFRHHTDEALGQSPDLIISKRFRARHIA